MTEPGTPEAQQPGIDGRTLRWQQHNAQRRAELVDSCLRAIRRHGAAVSMDVIAAEAATSKTVIYRHFTDRAGLYRAIADKVGRRIERALLDAIRSVSVPSVPEDPPFPEEPPVPEEPDALTLPVPEEPAGRLEGSEPAVPPVPEEPDAPTPSVPEEPAGRLEGSEPVVPPVPEEPDALTPSVPEEPAGRLEGSEPAVPPVPEEPDAPTPPVPEEPAGRLEGPNLATLGAIIDAYLALMETDPEVYRFVVRPPSVEGPVAEREVLDITDRAAAVLTDWLAGLGERRARVWSVGIVGAVHACADRWLADPSAVDRAELVDDLTALTWAGLDSGRGIAEA